MDLSQSEARVDDDSIGDERLHFKFDEKSDRWVENYSSCSKPGNWLGYQHVEYFMVVLEGSTPNISLEQIVYFFLMTSTDGFTIQTDKYQRCTIELIPFIVLLHISKTRETVGYLVSDFSPSYTFGKL